MLQTWQKRCLRWRNHHLQKLLITENVKNCELIGIKAQTHIQPVIFEYILVYFQFNIPFFGYHLNWSLCMLSTKDIKWRKSYLSCITLNYVEEKREPPTSYLCLLPPTALKEQMTQKTGRNLNFSPVKWHTTTMEKSVWFQAKTATPKAIHSSSCSPIFYCLLKTRWSHSSTCLPYMYSINARHCGQLSRCQKAADRYKSKQSFEIWRYFKQISKELGNEIALSSLIYITNFKKCIQWLK